jgi:hypothetical protein
MGQEIQEVDKMVMEPFISFVQGGYFGDTDLFSGQSR